MLKYENNILFEDKPLIIAVSLRKISCSKTRVKIIIFIFSKAKMDILLEEERVVGSREEVKLESPKVNVIKVLNLKNPRFCKIESVKVLAMRIEKLQLAKIRVEVVGR